MTMFRLVGMIFWGRPVMPNLHDLFHDFASKFWVPQHGVGPHVPLNIAYIANW